jgi:hypothetical protein
MMKRRKEPVILLVPRRIENKRLAHRHSVGMADVRLQELKCEGD